MSPVYVTGSTALEPILSVVAAKLQRNDPNKLTLVYQLTSSCAGVESVVRDSRAQTGSCAGGACITGKAKFWTRFDGDTMPATCDLDAAGTHVDVAFSDVFPQTCPGIGGTMTPDNVLEQRGPVSAHALVMSRETGEAAIQAEEAFFVFGKGQSAGVMPWVNNGVIMLRGDKSAGQLLLGLQLGLPANKFNGMPAATPTDVVLGVTSDKAAGIGILPTTLVDSKRSSLQQMAFQAFRQKGAFFPDRRHNSFEKQNVRDGHYPLWGYVHAVLMRDQTVPSQARSMAGQRVADIVLGRAQVAGMDPLELQVKAGLIPQCAMKVQRASDNGQLMPFMPTEACHCWFEKNVPNGMMACPDCSSTPCNVGVCRRNVCEVQ